MHAWTSLLQRPNESYNHCLFHSSFSNTTIYFISHAVASSMHLYCQNSASLVHSRDGGVLLGQRRESEVWLDGLEVGEQLPGFLVLDDGGDDDVVAWNPLFSKLVLAFFVHPAILIRSSPARPYTTNTQRQSPRCKTVRSGRRNEHTLIGVAILALSAVCRESTIRRTSAVLRPVEAG